MLIREINFHLGMGDLICGSFYCEKYVSLTYLNLSNFIIHCGTEDMFAFSNKNKCKFIIEVI